MGETARVAPEMRVRPVVPLGDAYGEVARRAVFLRVFLAGLSIAGGVPVAIGRKVSATETNRRDAAEFFSALRPIACRLADAV